MKDRLEASERENRRLRRTLAEGGARAERGQTHTVKGIPVLIRKVEGLKVPELRDLADSLKHKMGSGVVVLGEVAEGKAFIVVSITKDLTGRVQAGVLIRDLAPLIGGGGGGRPDFAQSGGSKTDALDRALESIPSLVEKSAT